MKKTLLTIISLLSLINVHAQSEQITDTTQKREPFKFEFYGFVRNDFTFDSRQSLASTCELFYFIPLDVSLNDHGEDLNAIPSSRFVSITSRVGFNVTSPLYRNLRIGAKIEMDLCGQANFATMLRIRHANVTFQWPHHRILFGQSWHPLTSDLIPEIVSLNTGAPFGAFSRTPQLRYDAYVGPVTLSAAAIYQFQYTSPGPQGNSSNYQVFGGIPEFYIGVSVGGNGWKVGASGEYLQIRPANEIDEVRVNASVRSFAAQLFAQYRTKHFDVAAKSIYGQNLGHLLLMSGYGEYGYDGSDPTTVRYTPLTQSSTWLNLGYHTTNAVHNVRTGLFAGYMKNLGTTHEVTGKTYMRGFDNIDQMFRISPSVKYSFKDLTIGLEYEYTGVYYGTTTPNITVTDTHLVSNHRAYLICVYNFDVHFQSHKKNK